MTTPAQPETMVAAEWGDLDPYLRPDLAHSALVTIDVQVDFLAGGSSPITGTDQVLPTISRLVESFRSTGRPIVHIVRLYEGADIDLVRRTLIESGATIVRPGTPGSQLAPELRPTEAPDLDAAPLLVRC